MSGSRSSDVVRIGVVVVVVAVVAAAAAFWRSGGSGEGEYADGDPAPATSRALVAVALSHIDEKPKYLEELWLDEGDPEGVLGADIRFEEDFLVRAYVAPEGEPRCTGSTECVTEDTDAGEVTISWQLLEPEEDPGYVDVSLQTDDEFRLVHFSGPGIEQDPRDLDLPIVSVDDLVAIVTDHAYGLTSTEQAVEAGEGIEDWPGEPEVVGEEEVTEPTYADWTPRALAAWAGIRLPRVLEAGPMTLVEPVRVRKRGTAVTLRLPSGALVHVVLLPTPDARNICPEGFECWEEGTPEDQLEMMYGTRDGLAFVFADRDNFAVRVYVEDPGLHVDSRADFDGDRGPLVAAVALAQDPYLGPLAASYDIEAGETYRKWRD